MDPHVPRRWTFVHRPLGLALLSLATALARATPARACDVCAIYTATEQSESRTGPQAGLAVQYTHFGTLEENGHEVPNPAGESLDSVITQVVLAYRFVPRFGLQ